jgi:hypothetical protein
MWCRPHPHLGAFQTNAPQLLKEGYDEVWKAADLRLFNLETPLADSASAANKCGPASARACEVPGGLAALNPTGVLHLQQPYSGSRRRRPGFHAGGAEGEAPPPRSARERDIDEADKPFFYARHGVRIGVYARCEHEFSCAHGSAGLARIRSTLSILGDRIRELKSNCDRLIVLYHGAAASTMSIRPRELQKTCRKIADCGASLVVCQHSTCVGSAEKWNGATNRRTGRGISFLMRRTAGAGFDTGLLVRYTLAITARIPWTMCPSCAFAAVRRLRTNSGQRRYWKGLRGGRCISAWKGSSLRVSVCMPPSRRKSCSEVFLSGNAMLSRRQRAFRPQADARLRPADENGHAQHAALRVDPRAGGRGVERRRSRAAAKWARVDRRCPIFNVKDANEMFFSILVPVYNSEPYLKECLDSVLRQSEQ